MNLKARVGDKRIEVFVVGKWRPVRYYQGKGVPSSKIQEEVKTTVRLNTGMPKKTPIKFEWK